MEQYEAERNVRVGKRIEGRILQKYKNVSVTLAFLILIRYTITSMDTERRRNMSCAFCFRAASGILEVNRLP